MHSYNEIKYIREELNQFNNERVGEDAHTPLNIVEYDANGNKTFKEYPNYETAYYFYDACDQFLSGVSLDLAGVLPQDSLVRDAVMKQKPFTRLYPKTEASKATAKLAQTVSRWPGAKRAGGNIQFFWKSILMRSR